MCELRTNLIGIFKYNYLCDLIEIKIEFVILLGDFFPPIHDILMPIWHRIQMEGDGMKRDNRDKDMICIGLVLQRAPVVSLTFDQLK